MMLNRPAPRIVLYGRYSTALQTSSSSADQVASCGPLVTYLGGKVVNTWLDPELSGYRRDRPGLKQLLGAIESGEVDIIVCEALDRLARDAEDVACWARSIAFHRVQLHTVSEGHVDEIKFAVAGLLGAIFLKHLIDKTLRGMASAVLAGRFAGGKAYGYKRVVQFDAKGELVRGLLAVDEEQAQVVQRIFAWFTAGLPSIESAKRLNEEGVPGPGGGQWNASTIRGDPKKLVGILNNPLYAGRLVWGRRQWRRNPDSEQRERRYRLRDASEWIEVAVPELRIVEDETAEAAQVEIERRQRPAVSGDALIRQNRQKHLPSGLIRCGCCGSNYTINGKDCYRCAGHKERVTCDNTASVRKEPLETATIVILQHGLLISAKSRRAAIRLGSDLAAVEIGVGGMKQPIAVVLSYRDPAMAPGMPRKRYEKDLGRQSIKVAYRIEPHPRLASAERIEAPVRNVVPLSRTIAPRADERAAMSAIGNFLLARREMDDSVRKVLNAASMVEVEVGHHDMAHVRG